MSKRLNDEEWLEKRKVNELKYKRNWAKIQITLKKAKEAGLSVSDEEVDTYLQNKNN